jgi:hypothetical protein
MGDSGVGQSVVMTFSLRQGRALSIYPGARTRRGVHGPIVERERCNTADP